MPASCPSRPRLSVAMIVRNEADGLADSIQSIAPVADETVVVDTGSSDQTAQILRRLGVTVHRESWSESFAAARNRCLEHVTGDWVLWLDGGERLIPESAAELRRFVSEEADRHTAYRVWVESPGPVPGASLERAAQLRLMPHGLGLGYEGRVRETLRPSMAAAGVQIADAPGRILCDGRRHRPDHKTKVARRDLALSEPEITESPSPRPAVLLAQGEAYSSLGQQREAIQAFRRAIEIAPRGSAEMLEAYYGLLSATTEDPAGQVELCLESLGVFPLDAQLLLAMGNCLQAQGRFDVAQRSFEAALKHGQVAPEIWHLAELAEVAAVCLGLTLQLRKCDDQAQLVLQQALQEHPCSMRIARHLLALHVKHGRCTEALKLVERLGMGTHPRHAMLDVVRGACRASAGDWTAALGYLQSAYVAGCRDSLCLRWLAVTLLAGTQIDAALTVLEEWQSREPANPELAAYLKVAHQMAPESRHWRVDAGVKDRQVVAPRFSETDQPAPGSREIR